MKVAILGSRGIPAPYGGFETFIEELALGLSSFGRDKVIVYCRRPYFNNRPSIYQGIHLIYLSAPRIKALESLYHSFISSLHVLGQKVDLVYFVDPANAPFCILLRLFGKKVIIHTDGLGWKRRKWGWLSQRYYKFAERLSARSASALITDNPVMQEYYRKEYCVDSVYIPYGATNSAGVNETVYQELGLSPKKYCLIVARFEPENNIDFMITEYIHSKVDIPLVIVGDAPYNASYTKELYSFADERVHFIGRINDQSKLNALYQGAYLYLHGHEVGGTNPSLLRAMQAGSAPVVINVPFNTTVIGECGFIFEKVEGNLSNILERLITDQTDVRRISNKAQERAQSHFKWESVIKQHKQLFAFLAGKSDQEEN
jgi:glycosyltransferase involved in cell wall biosynthesis